MKVLLIEDDFILQRLLSKMWAEQGVCVDIASSFEDAFTKIWRHQPDLIAAELRIKDQNLFDCLEKIRTISTRSVVVVSTVSLLYQDRETIGPRVDAYYTKPLLAENIIHMKELHNKKIEILDCIALDRKPKSRREANLE